MSVFRHATSLAMGQFLEPTIHADGLPFNDDVSEWRRKSEIDDISVPYANRYPCCIGCLSFSSADPGEVEGSMTVAQHSERHTTGRGHMPSAVRKAEARPPAPYPVSQVAADLGARVFVTPRA